MHSINEKYMSLAFLEAKKRLGRTEPNPAVGAIVVKNGVIVGRGFHLGSGSPHAEVEALKTVAEAEVAGSEVYVTLEPCCHHGKTPPCTDLLIEKKVKKVVYGFCDPNPLVAGKGIEKLKAHGVVVEHCVLPEIESLYEAYAYWQKNKRPFVNLKLALSKDDKMAGINGTRVKITGEQADHFTHTMRLESSAILSTAATVNADDPLFDCRLVSPEKKRLYIIDRSQTLRKDRKVFSSTKEVIVLQTTNDFLERVGRDGMHSIWVEAGPKFSHFLLSSNLVQRVYIYESNVVLGEGITFIRLPNPLESYRLAKTVNLGRDTLKIWESSR